MSISLVVVCCVIGALMPDLDASQSKIRNFTALGVRPFVPISIAINRTYGHRGALHSAWGWAVWTLLVLPLGITFGWLIGAALSLGYASHLAADACTRTGIPLLYPRTERYFLLPSWMRIVTGSAVEEVFFVTFACIGIMALVSR